jgi:hypothetical protein
MIESLKIPSMLVYPVIPTESPETPGMTESQEIPGMTESP